MLKGPSKKKPLCGQECEGVYVCSLTPYHPYCEDTVLHIPLPGLSESGVLISGTLEELVQQ